MEETKKLSVLDTMKPVVQMTNDEVRDFAKIAVDEIKRLNEQLDKANADKEAERDMRLREYRKVDILKGTLNLLKEKYSITDADYYAALLSGGNGELDIDTILYQLAK